MSSPPPPPPTQSRVIKNKCSNLSQISNPHYLKIAYVVSNYVIDMKRRLIVFSPYDSMDTVSMCDKDEMCFLNRRILSVMSSSSDKRSFSNAYNKQNKDNNSVHENNRIVLKEHKFMPKTLAKKCLHNPPQYTCHQTKNIRYGILSDDNHEYSNENNIPTRCAEHKNDNDVERIDLCNEMCMVKKCHKRGLLYITIPSAAAAAAADSSNVQHKSCKLYFCKKHATFVYLIFAYLRMNHHILYDGKSVGFYRAVVDLTKTKTTLSQYRSSLFSLDDMITTLPIFTNRSHDIIHTLDFNLGGTKQELKRKHPQQQHPHQHQQADNNKVTCSHHGCHKKVMYVLDPSRLKESTITFLKDYYKKHHEGLVSSSSIISNINDKTNEQLLDYYFGGRNLVAPKIWKNYRKHKMYMNDSDTQHPQQQKQRSNRKKFFYLFCALHSKGILHESMFRYEKLCQVEGCTNKAAVSSNKEQDNKIGIRNDSRNNKIRYCKKHCAKQFRDPTYDKKFSKLRVIKPEDDTVYATVIPSSSGSSIIRNDGDASVLSGKYDLNTLKNKGYTKIKCEHRQPSCNRVASYGPTIQYEDLIKMAQQKQHHGSSIQDDKSETKLKHFFVEDVLKKRLIKPVYCYQHKPKDYINVVKRRCDVPMCLYFAHYGYPGMSPQRCKTHAVMNMVKYPRLYRMNDIYCSICHTAIYNDVKDFAANDTYSDDEHTYHIDDIVEYNKRRRRQKSSLGSRSSISNENDLSLYNINKRIICSRCLDSLTDNQNIMDKYKVFIENKPETIVLSYMDRVGFGDMFTHDRMLPLSNHRYRPDFKCNAHTTISCGNVKYSLILEVDEFQHRLKKNDCNSSSRGYSCMNEIDRMVRIYEDLKTYEQVDYAFFVRFNPNDYKVISSNTNSNIMVYNESLLRYVNILLILCKLLEGSNITSIRSIRSSSSSSSMIKDIMQRLKAIMTEQKSMVSKNQQSNKNVVEAFSIDVNGFNMIDRSLKSINDMICNYKTTQLSHSQPTHSAQAPKGVYVLYVFYDGFSYNDFVNFSDMSWHNWDYVNTNTAADAVAIESEKEEYDQHQQQQQYHHPNQQQNQAQQQQDYAIIQSELSSFYDKTTSSDSVSLHGGHMLFGNDSSIWNQSYVLPITPLMRKRKIDDSVVSSSAHRNVNDDNRKRRHIYRDSIGSSSISSIQ